MSIQLIKTEPEQEISFSVLGPDSANTLRIYTGTAVIAFKGYNEHWSKDTLSFDVGEKLTSTQFRKAIGFAALASIANEGKSNFAGWAIDQVSVKRSATTGKPNISLALAVRDGDGYLYRISYMVHVLAAT